MRRYLRFLSIDTPRIIDWLSRKAIDFLANMQMPMNSNHLAKPQSRR